MNKLITLSLMLLPALAFAQQNFQNMSQEDMQKMMANMQKMQACMQGVDQQELEAFSQRGQQMEQEVRKLCAAGKRDEAQSKAMAFGKEVMANQAMKQMTKCGEMMAGMMPKLPFLEQVKEEKMKSTHICDNQ